MQKIEIAKRIHQEAGIPQEQAATLLDWFFEFLKATLLKGEPIAIQSFGKFTVRKKAAREGRNPGTGEAMTITARRVVTFYASALLKAEVNPVLAERQETLSPAE